MREFIVKRTGNNVEMEKMPNNTIPVYASQSDLENDLANLEVGQIVSTKDELTQIDLATERLKEYIRDQDELSDFERLPNSTDGWTTTSMSSYISTTTQPNNSFTMPYDGFIKVSVVQGASGSYGYLYISQDGGTTWTTGGLGVKGDSRLGFTSEIYLNKGDLFAVYCYGNTATTDSFQILARYYKKRDYSHRS